MLLDSLRPQEIEETNARYIHQLDRLDAERKQYDRLLEGKLDEIQRRMMEARKARVMREAQLRRAYLSMLQSVEYTDDDATIWQRSFQVA
ncbi:MAG: hypothetical protein KDD73_15640 [Anaerolineales bacterium]|nr:hypothetical protein [Anaerolineales bacterium]MCB9128290.1 hypothetical protein [Ardenticatenales bacterium]MCB9172081.1 hypothetical protein [Ardenticatenales bacterium]